MKPNAKAEIGKRKAETRMVLPMAAKAESGKRKAEKSVRNRESADALAPSTNPGGPAPAGVKDVPSLQAPAKKLPLIRGGTTSGSPGQPVRFWNRWRENYNALLGLTLRRVRELNEQTQRGDHAYPQWTYRIIERRHPVLKALIDCCEAPLENFKWDVRIKKELPAGYTPEDAEKQKECLKNAYAQIGNLRAALVHLHSAEFRGYAHLQKHYDAVGNVVHLECLHQYCICRDGLFGDWFWNPDSRAMSMPELVLTAANRIGGDELPREDFVIHDVERPINEIALENYVRRKLIEKDWSAFDEIFGIPSGVVIMPPEVPVGKELEYEAAARSISEGGNGALPHGSEYKPNDAARDGSALFKVHTAQLDEDLVLAGTGGKLKMLVSHAGHGSGGESRGSSKVQDDTFAQIAQSRGNKISGVLHRDLDQVLLAKDFPGQPALAEFCLVTEEKTDVSALCNDVATLKQAGKNVSTDWLAEQTGYEFEEDDKPIANSESQISNPESQAPPSSNQKLPKNPLLNRDLNSENQTSNSQFEIRNSQFLSALNESLLPLLKRLDAIAQVPDAAIQQQLLAKLLRDFPQISKAIQADDSVQKEMSAIVSDGLLAGLTAKPGQDSPPKTTA